MEMDSCKLFIGGISWETSEDRLREYFQTFGEVLEAVIMKDRATGRARGFGFVVFADPAVAERVVSQTQHMIGGKTVEAKKAVPRDDHTISNKSNSSVQGSPGPANTKKIFVGGLASSVTEAEFKKYFAQFGTITDVVVMYDHKTQRPRGFGFITYDSEEAVDKVLQKTFHELNGKMVEVKQAVPKEFSPVPIRNQINGYSFACSRIGSLLNEYTQGYNPNPIGGYGVKAEGRYSPATTISRAVFSPFGHGYGIELNFEPNPNPNFGVSSNGNGNFGRPFSPASYAANQGRFGNLGEFAGGSIGNGSAMINPVARNLWGNGSLNYASSSSISSAFTSSNSGISSLGSIGENWSSSARGRSSYLSYSNEDFSVGSGSGYSRNSRPGGVGLESNNGINQDDYTLSGDLKWRSSSPTELERSLSFSFGIGPPDFMSKPPAAYVGGYDVTNRQPNGGIAA